MWSYNLLITKHFHGVSSGNQPPYLLKSRYGKARPAPTPGKAVCLVLSLKMHQNQSLCAECRCGARVVSATRGHMDLRRAVAYRISGDAHRTVSLRIQSTPEAPARGQSSDVVHHGVRI